MARTKGVREAIANRRSGDSSGNGIQSGRRQLWFKNDERSPSYGPTRLPRLLA